MTSVPNHRRRSSGSRLALAFAMLLLMSACGIFNPDKQGKTVERDIPEEKEEMVRVYNPETGAYQLVPLSEVRVDTVDLRDITEIAKPPVGEMEKEPVSLKKDAYQMSLLVPFNAIRYQRISDPVDPRGRRFIHYYAGTRLAIDDLMREGYRVDLNVFDTEDSNTKLQSILETPAVINSDLVIGTYRRSNVEALAAFSNKQKKIVISPWIPGFDVGHETPRMIQMTPGLEAHAKAIFSHIRTHYGQARVFLVGRDKGPELNRIKMFRKAYLSNGLEPDSLATLIVDDITSTLENTDWSLLFEAPGKAIFVLPYYATGDESFVNSVLRKIHAEKLEKEVLVFGLPQWLGFTSLNYDYLESLKVHVSSISFTDKERPRFESFQNRFFERYGIVPEEPAFRGYDLVYHFGKVLHLYGTNFISELDRRPVGGTLNLGIDLQPVYKTETPDRPIREEPLYIGNQGIRILRFENHQFKVAR